MLLEYFLNGAWVLKVIKISKLLVMLFVSRVLWLIGLNWSLSKYFSLFCFGLSWEIILVFFSAALTATNSTPNLSKLDSSLASWHYTYTGLVVVLKIWFAFFAAKMKVFFLSVFLVIILVLLMVLIVIKLGLVFDFCL